MSALLARPIRMLAAASALLLLALGLAACGGGSSSGSGDPEIVVTTPVLGAVVRDLVGDRAQVTVLMPDGIDPHDWQPSAKDIEAVNGADLVVTNGLDLEEGLEDALDTARSAGVPVFAATDHIAVRRIGEGEVAEHGHEDEAGHEDEGEHGDEHAAGAEDPHFWTDPASMRRVVAGLAAALKAEAGLDVAESAAAEDRRLAELDREVARTLATIPADRRRLVTGHESLGYLARRYDLDLVGALIPSLTSQATVSAAQLAELKEQIADQDVDVIFTEIGTPKQVADAIARETGARVVELATHTLPDDGSYSTFMTELASGIAGSLTPPSRG